MSIKQLVNSPELYKSLLSVFEDKITLLQQSLEQAKDPLEIYRLQGQIMCLRRLTHLREEINTKEKP